jgi:hypothetical protein
VAAGSTAAAAAAPREELRLRVVVVAATGSAAFPPALLARPREEARGGTELPPLPPPAPAPPRGVGVALASEEEGGLFSERDSGAGRALRGGALRRPDEPGGGGDVGGVGQRVRFRFQFRFQRLFEGWRRRRKQGAIVDPWEARAEEEEEEAINK